MKRIPCMHRLDPGLLERMKTAAHLEGMYVYRWLENAITNELARKAELALKIKSIEESSC